MTHWPVFVPLGAASLLAITLLMPLGTALAVLSVIALVASVLAAVHHAEVVAHRVGEPFGTLVLALAITAIEVALIISLMLAGGPDKAALARDTVYATVMIISSGVIGICLLLGGWRYREQTFRIEGAGPAFAAMVTLATLVLVMPVFTKSAAGGSYSPTTQLAFVGVSSLLLWCVFVFFQTVRHRDYFLPRVDPANEASHAPPPSGRQALASLALLLVSLVSVVGLAKMLVAADRGGRAGRRRAARRGRHRHRARRVAARDRFGAARRAGQPVPDQPEPGAGFGAGQHRAHRAGGGAVAALFDLPLVLGLAAKDMVLMTLSFVVGSIALGSGRTNMMQGAVQLVIFAAFLFLSLVP